MVIWIKAMIAIPCRLNCTAGHTIFVVILLLQTYQFRMHSWNIKKNTTESKLTNAKNVQWIFRTENIYPACDYRLWKLSIIFHVCGNMNKMMWRVDRAHHHLLVTTTQQQQNCNTNAIRLVYAPYIGTSLLYAIVLWLHYCVWGVMALSAFVHL